MSNEIKCCECMKQKKKSHVYIEMKIKTLMKNSPCYDKNGKYNHCDKNIIKIYFKCSNNHEWVTTDEEIIVCCCEHAQKNY